MQLVLAAREPVPVDAIEALLGCTRKERVKAGQALSNLLPVRDGRMHPYHKTLFDWLREEPKLERPKRKEVEPHALSPELAMETKRQDTTNVVRRIIAALGYGIPRRWPDQSRAS